MKYLLSILAFTFIVSTSSAQSPLSQSPVGITSPKTAAFKGGEMLKYTVSYRAAMWPNTDMATVTLETADDDVNGMPAFRITAYARVMGMFRWFYKLDDYYDSWLSKGDLRPIKATSELTEGNNYRFSGSLSYDWRSMRISSRYRNHKNPDHTTKEMKLTKGAMDAVSLLYNLRSTDIASYEPGEINSLHLVLDDTIRVIKYKFYDREVKDVPDYGEVNTLKFSCQLVTSEADSFKEGSEFYVWISDDPNKIPLYMELPLKVGSARVRLSEYKNLKSPYKNVLIK